MADSIHRHIIPAAYEPLPSVMASDRATAYLLAIGWHESEFKHRLQVPSGIARGFWQFEQSGGVVGVLGHRRTADLARSVWNALSYPGEPSTWAIYDSIAHNDVLACAFARLLLWTVPAALVGRDREEAAWQQYRDGWRPGAAKEPGSPRYVKARQHWTTAWAQAWRRVDESTTEVRI
jgi:hypothetical protein